MKSLEGIWQPVYAELDGEEFIFVRRLISTCHRPSQGEVFPHAARASAQKMSHADKLRAMETIWADLSRNEGRFESPAWHGEALLETQRLVKAGKAKFSDWEEAKARLRRKTAKAA